MCPTLGLPLGGLSSLLSPELLFACVVLLPTWLLPTLVVYKFVLYFINGPPRVLAPYQSLPGVLQLLIEKLWCSAYSFGSMGKYNYDTVLSKEIMMTIPRK